MKRHLQTSLFDVLFKQGFRRSSTQNSSSLNLGATIQYRLVSSLIPSPKTPTSRIPISNLHLFSNVHGFDLWAKLTTFQNLRGYSGGSVPDLDQNKEVDMINLKFAEAREEIDMAMESKDTVYFDEEAECARAAVKEVLGMFEDLLAKLPESERAAVQRSMGLKIEQLKAELQQLDE